MHQMLDAINLMTTFNIINVNSISILVFEPPGAVSAEKRKSTLALVF